jgi:hypothetical protein
MSLLEKGFLIIMIIGLRFIYMVIREGVKNPEQKQMNQYPLTEGNVMHRDRTYAKVDKRPTTPPSPIPSDLLCKYNGLHPSWEKVNYYTIGRCMYCGKLLSHPTGISEEKR